MIVEMHTNTTRGGVGSLIPFDNKNVFYLYILYIMKIIYISSIPILISILMILVILHYRRIKPSVIPYRSFTKETFYQWDRTKGDVLFTCTSYVTLPNKFNELDKALSSFLHYNSSERINEFILINEYDPISNHLIEKISHKYPNIIIWNKSKEQKGQAQSINMIIDYLRRHKYKYWLHWEDSWWCLDRFIDQILYIMDHRNIDQFTLKNDFWGSSNIENRIDSMRYDDYKYHTEMTPTNLDIYNPNIPWHKDINKWPLFSLCCGIDRVDTILKSGYFSTEIDKWPVTFEYEFACEWIKHITRVAGFKKPYIERKSDHKSTYS